MDDKNASDEQAIAPGPKNALPKHYRDPQPFSVSAQAHELTFLPGGQQRFEAVIETIENARSSLHIYYYMFQDDGSGTKVRDALVEAATNGVDVHLIVDRFGTDAPNSFFDPIVEAGGQFHLFNPRLNVRYLIRNHQKMLIADETKALVGGFNISDHYFSPASDNGWNDLGVTITGPVVADLLNWFGQIAQWCSAKGTQYRAIRTMVRDWEPGDGAVQMLVGGPTRVPSNWARRFRQDLMSAKRLDMVMAYFSPPLSFRRLIRKVAKRGKARLVMAGKSDNGVTIGASRALYPALLRSGVKLREFQPSKLHAKLVVVDDIAYFGSSNFDQRSLRLNVELMLRIEDRALAERLREYIDHFEHHSEPITREWLGERNTLWNRIRWGISWLLVGVLDYTVSRRLNLGL